MWSFASDGHYQDLFAWFKKRRNHQKYFFHEIMVYHSNWNLFYTFLLFQQFHKNLYKDVFLLGKRCGTTFLPVSTNLLETQPFWEFGYQTFSEAKSQYNWVPEFEEQFLIFDVPDEVTLANLREIGLKWKSRFLQPLLGHQQSHELSLCPRRWTCKCQFWGDTFKSRLERWYVTDPKNIGKPSNSMVFPNLTKFIVATIFKPHDVRFVISFSRSGGNIIANHCNFWKSS